MMNLGSLVWKYLWAKPLNTVLNVILLALGIAVITLIFIFNRQLQEKITQNTKGIDLVVGAKGSPLQIILCSVFHMDFPTGNIKLAEAERLSQHRLVKSAIPLAMGDSYQTYRIIGTTQAYPELYGATLAQGTWWQHDLEVVAGATVAQLLSLKVGDTFASAHGLSEGGHAHDGHQLTVTGILERNSSVVDNLLLTNIETVWEVHETEPQDSVHKTILNPSPLIPSVEAGDTVREVTSLLIKYRNPIAAIQLPRLINSNTNMQAASPAFESARLFSILGAGVDVLMGFAYLLIFISALSIFIALYNSLKERKYDLAIMRSMGATKSRLFTAIVCEGVALTLAGALAGLAMGHEVLALFVQWVGESQRAGMSAWVFYPEEIYLLGGSLALGFLCSLLPAWQAYRTDIHRVLAGS